MNDRGRPLAFGVFPEPAADRLDDILAMSLLAEELGLDLVGIQDHPYQRRYLDTVALLAWLAGRTERIGLLTDVGNLPLRGCAAAGEGRRDHRPAERRPVRARHRGEAALAADREPAEIRRIYNIDGTITDGDRGERLLDGPPDHRAEQILGFAGSGSPPAGATDESSEGKSTTEGGRG